MILMVLFALTLGVLAWGVYEAFYVAIVGRWRLSMTATLEVVLVLFLFFATMYFTP